MAHTRQFKLVFPVLLLALAHSLLPGQTPNGSSGGVRGTVYTVGPDRSQAVVPGARVMLQPAAEGRPGAEATTDALGVFSAADLAPGTYRLSVEFTGLCADPINVLIEAGKTVEASIELKLAEVKEEVTVSAQTDAVDTTQTSSEASLKESTLTNAPNLTENVQGILPVLPGVVRGPDGLINMKGGRSSQGGVLLNSANVTDSVTGYAGINLPIDVVSTARVLTNPYDPEYGKVAGAVATVDTRVSNFDKFRFSVQNFMPRMRHRDGSIMGIEAATPRFTVTGPIKPGRIAITQSLEYRYVRTPIETLPPLQRDTGLESFDSYTQLDLNITEHQNASVTLAIYPQKLNYLGLNTFNPQPSTPDLHQRGEFLAFSHRYISQSGAMLASQVSFKTFDSDVKPHSDDLYRLEVETTTGGFFNRQNRDTNRFEWQEVYTPRAFTGWGRHQFKAGWGFVRNSYDGTHSYGPVEVVRESGLPAERIEYSPAVTTYVRQREYTAFVQDKWTIHPKLTLDAGLRADRDSLSDESHAAPRIGLAYAPFLSGRTVIRAGAGYFYDRINLNVPTFTSLPSQTVTRFQANGLASSVISYPHKLAGPLDNPRSTSWNVELQQMVRPDLMLRVGYNQRNTIRNFFVDSEQDGASGYLLLSNGGRDRYREFEVTARYTIRRHVLNASYVRSGALGDLNDFNQFFGNTPNPIIRRNERGRLSFDAPNRVVVWGQFEAPWKITISPVWDIHTGFPYSVYDEERDFVGARNYAGRFPRFSSADLQITKQISLPYLPKKYKAHVGVRMFNIFNHYNPRDIQANTVSPRYGAFLNSVDRMIRGKMVLEF